MDRPRTDCRCCRGTELAEVFDLGCQPFANAFPDRRAQPETTCPLILCECQACGHLQLSRIVDPGTLYRDYPFQTGTSRRMAAHFAGLMAEIAAEVPTGGLIVEIGSNDGTALASIARQDIRRLGIDPAANLGRLAEARGVRTIRRFFTERLAGEIADHYGQADRIIACNVLAHVDNLDGFLQGIRRLLSPSGRFIVEVPDARQMIERTEFDTIYHEHLSYFAPGPLAALLRRHGLGIETCDPIDVHGGSMRLTISTAGQWTPPESPSVDWLAFAERAQEIRETVRDWLADQKAAGQIVWGYGAPAKGTVFLNYCGIGTELLPVVVDCTPSKQGRFMPGTHQPIRRPEEFNADFALVLAWNHFAEIAKREASLRCVNPRNIRARVIA